MAYNTWNSAGKKSGTLCGKQNAFGIKWITLRHWSDDFLGLSLAAGGREGNYWD